MRTTSFCSRPIEPETSMMWKITAEESGCGQLLRARKRSSSLIGITRGRLGSHWPEAIVRFSARR